MKWVAALVVSASLIGAAVVPASTHAAPPLGADPTVEITVKIGGQDDGAVITGSGVHVGSGVIVTAAHVVSAAIKAAADGKQPVTLTVTLDDAGKAGADVAAHVLWAEPKEDIAAIQIDTVPAGLGIATVDATNAMSAACGRGTCGGIEVIGQPFGVEFVHTFGRIAGAERNMIGTPWRHAVPIDVRVGPGNSGGPVYRTGTHEVEGIVVGVISEFVPMQFGSEQHRLAAFPSGVNIMVSSSEVAKLLADHHTMIVADGGTTVGPQREIVRD